MTPRLLSAILLALLFTAASFAQERHKTVRVLGLRVISEERLKGELGLDRLPAGRPAFEKAASLINAHYFEKGYLIARAFLVRETPDELDIFVDEGRIDRLIFYNLNTINTLRMRYEFKLHRDVYNLYGVEERLGEIRKRFNFKSMGAKLIPVRNYDVSFFQIDREFSIPLLGPQKLPFFEEYKPRYDLGVYIQRFAAEETGGVTYGIRTSYSQGLKPYVRYTHPSIIGEKDRLETTVSAGIFYGLDLKPQEPPRWSFMEFNANYGMPPVFEKYFTPSVKGYVYRSWSSRSDLGLAQYEYLILRGTLSPGITLLNRYRIYAGYGVERVEIYDSETDEGAPYIADITRETDDWGFFELGMRINLFPWSLRHLIDRNFSFTYNYYMNDTDFHKLALEGTLGFEFTNFDILSFGMDAVWFWRDPPFYHEEGIDGFTFKGFMGKSYHSRKVGRLSGEYRISVFKDYIFTGIYADGTAFLGSGYDLTGWQHGVAGGFSGHAIFMDQFEFNIYFGRDYLFSSGESHYNIYISLEKKW